LHLIKEAMTNFTLKQPPPEWLFRDDWLKPLQEVKQSSPAPKKVG
jgi:hypothetical protein